MPQLFVMDARPCAEQLVVARLTRVLTFLPSISHDQLFLVETFHVVHKPAPTIKLQQLLLHRTHRYRRDVVVPHC
jgi:hypothetical protein